MSRQLAEALTASKEALSSESTKDQRAGGSSSKCKAHRHNPIESVGQMDTSTAAEAQLLLGNPAFDPGCPSCLHRLYLNLETLPELREELRKSKAAGRDLAVQVELMAAAEAEGVCRVQQFTVKTENAEAQLQRERVAKAAVEAAGRSASMDASLKQMVQIVTRMVKGEVWMRLIVWKGQHRLEAAQLHATLTLQQAFCSELQQVASDRGQLQQALQQANTKIDQMLHEYKQLQGGLLEVNSQFEGVQSQSVDLAQQVVLANTKLHNADAALTAMQALLSRVSTITELPHNNQAHTSVNSPKTRNIAAHKQYLLELGRQYEQHQLETSCIDALDTN